MPKNNEVKSKSGRKVLTDVTNNGGPKRSTVAKKKLVSEKVKEENRVQNDEEALDLLLLVQSDLSALLHQIDELVVKAFNVKSTSKQGRKEIESFTHVLSEMLAFLKPWVPRFQKVLSSPSMDSENQLEQSLENKVISPVNEEESNVIESPEQSKLDSLISPSPLVSWRANCTIERGRQLFLLTPMPTPKVLSTKPQHPSKSIFENFTSNTTLKLPSNFTFSQVTNHDLLEGVAVEPTPSKTSDSVAIEKGSFLENGFISPSISRKRNPSLLVMTPCLKMSPPKSCVLLEPIAESTHHNNVRFRRATPFPVGIKCYGESQFSESSSGEDSEGLALKYPELMGIQPAHKLGIRRKEVESSPGWFLSPPKSCVLLEPPDEKPLNNAGTNCRILRTGLNSSLVKENNAQGGCYPTKKSFETEPLGGSLALIESTPLWKDPENTMLTNKRPGENTLKKELWTKFEAASTNEAGLHFSVLWDTTQKGFLDRLDEVSSDETVSASESLT